jgi:hypothetical protein
MTRRNGCELEVRTVKKTCVLSLLAAALLAWPQGYAAEGDQPAQGADANARPGPGQRGGGGPGGGGPGGRGNWMNNLGGMAGALLRGGPGGAQSIYDVVSRMLGLDIEDPKAGPKMEILPLGADKRFVFSVPVGGVDNPGSQTNGWKMEALFKMTDEQTKSAEALRAEYAGEEKKLEQEVQDQFKALAEKLKQLRLKYEQRANDILTADDKQRKEKMDALGHETSAKNTALVKELLPLYDINDFQQRAAMARAVREKADKNAREAEGKLVELVPPDTRDKIEAVFRQQAQERDRMARFQAGGGGGGGPGGRGMRGGQQDQQPVKPPRPPEADKKQDF